eukprot:TRINITY_DN2687_c0_g1_i2.p1 TRINITY_DN2687_c0_g1~~TRINITY_DN2687_c0_g1_i2.p1  ORF type:complete len:554 (-),score=142.49 TRINITY_DN2687_c0_g1_i2:25-1686(-)
MSHRLNPYSPLFTSFPSLRRVLMHRYDKMTRDKVAKAIAVIAVTIVVAAVVVAVAAAASNGSGGGGGGSGHHGGGGGGGHHAVHHIHSPTYIYMPITSGGGGSSSSSGCTNVSSTQLLPTNNVVRRCESFESRSAFFEYFFGNIRSVFEYNNMTQAPESEAPLVLKAIPLGNGSSYTSQIRAGFLRLKDLYYISVPRSGVLPTVLIEVIGDGDVSVRAMRLTAPTRRTYDARSSKTGNYTESIVLGRDTQPAVRDGNWFIGVWSDERLRKVTYTIHVTIIEDVDKNKLYSRTYEDAIQFTRVDNGTVQGPGAVAAAAAAAAPTVGSQLEDGEWELVSVDQSVVPSAGAVASSSSSAPAAAAGGGQPKSEHLSKGFNRMELSATTREREPEEKGNYISARPVPSAPPAQGEVIAMAAVGGDDDDDINAGRYEPTAPPMPGSQDTPANVPTTSSTTTGKGKDKIAYPTKEISRDVQVRYDQEVPLEYCCPITMDLMDDPVLFADGHTYQRDAIVQWLCEHDTSPMTGVTMQGNKTLTPNIALRKVIEEWSAKHKK